MTNNVRKIETPLTKLFSVPYPIILAPMFLVSNEEMIIAASNAGILGCIPAHNYRTPKEFSQAITKIKNGSTGPFGVNLIVNKSNIQLKEQLKICVENKIGFIITSLGSPEKVIKASKKADIKVFCDVTDLKYAKKVEKMGADALIAVNSGAGGHAGNIPAQVLVPQLKEHCSIPVISAGGIGTGNGLYSVLSLGACGASIGSPFIAATESPVGPDYKKATMSYGASDIVSTTKLSGTPCTVINTPYMKKIGTKQNFVESFLNKNKQIKKWAKMITFYRGTQMIRKAAFGATYKTVWCAGPSIEFVNKDLTIQQIVDNYVDDFFKTHDKMNATLS